MKLNKNYFMSASERNPSIWISPCIVAASPDMATVLESIDISESEKPDCVARTCHAWEGRIQSSANQFRGGPR